jgi:hypothetical protein
MSSKVTNPGPTAISTHSLLPWYKNLSVLVIKRLFINDFLFLGPPRFPLHDFLGLHVGLDLVRGFALRRHLRLGQVGRALFGAGGWIRLLDRFHHLPPSSR